MALAAAIAVVPRVDTPWEAAAVYPAAAWRSQSHIQDTLWTCTLADTEGMLLYVAVMS